MFMHDVHIVPLAKGKPNKNEILNYRPVSILNTFSKIYEKLLSSIEKYFFAYISGYRKGYSPQDVHIRLLEEWRNKLDSNLFVRAVLMDLSKAFDCIPLDLIIAEMAANGMQNYNLRLLFSYLTSRKQCV